MPPPVPSALSLPSAEVAAADVAATASFTASFTASTATSSDAAAVSTASAASEANGASAFASSVPVPVSAPSAVVDAAATATSSSSTTTSTASAAATGSQASTRASSTPLTSTAIVDPLNITSSTSGKYNYTGPGSRDHAVQPISPPGFTWDDPQARLMLGVGGAFLFVCLVCCIGFACARLARINSDKPRQIGRTKSTTTTKTNEKTPLRR